MTTLWCSHCGIPYKFTQEELTQLLIAGILYVDCLNCSNEIPLPSENHSGLTETEIRAVQEMEDEIREESDSASS